MTPLVYDIKEALEVLPVSRATLYQLMKAGEIRRIKIGRRTFIKHEELERFVAQMERANA